MASWWRPAPKAIAGCISIVRAEDNALGASAVQLGLSEINAAEWTDERGRWDAVSDDELRDELENLKDEMKELRRELRRLQREKDSR